MGLDIYFHIVKAKRSPKKNDIAETPTQAYTRMDRNAKRRFVRWGEKVYNNMLNAADEEIYQNMYSKFVNDLPTFFPRFSFKYEKFLEGTKSIEDVKEFLDDEKKYFHKESDAYFRKVNFIYRYFQDILDEEQCIVSKSDISELKDVCEQVMTDHNLAIRLLPTTAGFFFGSTEYDEYYFDDVADCAQQMDNLLMQMGENDKVLIIMSW